MHRPITFASPQSTSTSKVARPIERHDLDWFDRVPTRTLLLSESGDEMQAAMHLEHDADEFVSLRTGCNEGDSRVLRSTVCSNGGSVTTVTLQECQSTGCFPQLGSQCSTTAWITTWTGTSSSGGGCGGPSDDPQE